MSQNPFSTIIDRLDKVKDEFEGEDVKVYLPRFAAKSDLTLNTVLEKVEFEEEKNITSTNKRLSISDGNNRRVRPRDSWPPRHVPSFSVHLSIDSASRDRRKWRGNCRVGRFRLVPQHAELSLLINEYIYFQGRRSRTRYRRRNSSPTSRSSTSSWTSRRRVSCLRVEWPFRR